jgi:transposase
MDLALAVPPVHPMGQRTLVPDAGEVVLHELKADGQNRLVMVLRSAGKEGCCPECGQPSRRVHSRYNRPLSDLPWEGLPVQIELRVRRFFCTEDDCGQRIFTERLPNTVARHGRRTCRLSAALDRITLALGGSAGSRLAEHLGILTHGSTLLRGLRKRPNPRLVNPPRVVGIDDWAWRKGQRYGTILCDLEQGKVIDLLADRSAESTAAWLREHPGIEIVSRDRASLYAEAADTAAPHAVQVADRWHLLRNLGDALVGVLATHHSVMVEAARAACPKPEVVSEPEPKTVNGPTRAQRAKQQSRERRLNRYQSVLELMRKGMSQAAISRSMGVDRRTVRRWTRAGAFPERKQVHRTSSIEEYRRYLDQRWQDGCHNATQLWREMRGLGFRGMGSVVRHWIQQHYGRKNRSRREPIPPKPPSTSPRQSAWQILKPTESTKAYLDELFRRSPEIASSAELAREFFRIIRNRDLNAWPKWRESALHSPLASFAKHLCRDEAALLAALKYKWSNGPVEGNVHRLKLIKRSMYGRAKFDLLRLRVLSAA